MINIEEISILKLQDAYEKKTGNLQRSCSLLS